MYAVNLIKRVAMMRLQRQTLWLNITMF